MYYNGDYNLFDKSAISIIHTNTYYVQLVLVYYITMNCLSVSLMPKTSSLFITILI